MACIKMKPDDDGESNKAEMNMVATSVYNFYLGGNGASLCPGFYE